MIFEKNFLKQRSSNEICTMKRWKCWVLILKHWSKSFTILDGIEKNRNASYSYIVLIKKKKENIYNKSL